VADVSSGLLDIRRFRTPDELLCFHDVARRISIRTYQERLMGGGLPDDDAFVQAMLALAAADKVRAWLLYIAGEPAAYLYCPVVGDTVRYDHVGHDPAFSDFSPGAVLHLEAMRDLFDEGRFARFDFTEGEGQHKRQLATGGVACVDMLLLRASLANRLTTVALGGFDKATAAAKQATETLGLQRVTRKLRRA
jgi:CelD/BcsL family acetyltransferase involved in cellulose biosynthesis